MNIRGLGTMAESARKVLEGIFGEADSSPKPCSDQCSTFLTECASL